MASRMRDAFEGLIVDKIKQEEDAKDVDAAPVAQADDLIDFRHLKSRKGLSRVELEERWRRISSGNRVHGSSSKDGAS